MLIMSDEQISGMTEVTTDTTDTTDRNDQPVAVGGIGNGAGQEVGTGEGACPLPRLS